MCRGEHRAGYEPLKRALITGGAGFLGVHLARRLVECGTSVDLVDNFSRGVRDADLVALAESDSALLLQADLLEPDALRAFDERYDFIFHLAAIVGVRHVLDNPFAVLRDNVAMLFSALEYARYQPSLERFVFASTSEVYACVSKHLELELPTSESVPLVASALDHPRTSYQLSKIYGEAACHQADLPFTIIRPHNVYGPRMGLSHAIPELLQRAHAAPAGGLLDVYSADHRRSFCYIDDAVEMIRLAAESSQCVGETLNVGNEETLVRIDELAERIVAVVGKELAIRPLPATVGSPPVRCPDMRKMTAATDYRAQVGLEEGLRRTYDWYRTSVFEGAESSAV